MQTVLGKFGGGWRKKYFLLRAIKGIEYAQSWVKFQLAEFPKQ